jgi:hypothetical protein
MMKCGPTFGRAGPTLVFVLLAAAAVARAAEKDPIEQFFRALDKRERAAASAVLHPEATLWKLGDERPTAVGGGILDVLLARYPDFPKWSTKIATRIGAGSFAAVRERIILEKGERPRETLFLFQVRQNVIRRIWEMDASEEGGEGAVSLLVEKWNERDLPRFLALFDGDISFWELPSGERLGSGEDAVRDRYEKVFENGDAPRLEITERMSLAPWTIYHSRPSMDGEGGEDALTIFQTRDNSVRRVWFVRPSAGS